MIELADHIAVVIHYPPARYLFFTGGICWDLDIHNNIHCLIRRDIFRERVSVIGAQI